MDNENNLNNNPGSKPGERTFTQEEVNLIVGERLAKEKSKGEKGNQDFSKREQELAQRENMMTAKEMFIERGLPVELVGIINCSDAEALEKSADIIDDVITKIKSERSKVTIKGARPAESSNSVLSGLDTSDEQLRQAMGLQ